MSSSEHGQHVADDPDAENVAQAAANENRSNDDTHGDGQLEKEDDSESKEAEMEAKAKELFDRMDKNSDGGVTKAELKAALLRGGDVKNALSLKRSGDAAKLIDGADEDADGTMDFEEFKKIWRTLQEGTPEADSESSQTEMDAKAKEIFDKIDKYRDGRVTKAELKGAIALDEDVKQLLNVRSPGDASKLIDDADVDNSGSMDFDEFKKVWRTLHEGAPQATKEEEQDGEDDENMSIAAAMAKLGEVQLHLDNLHTIAVNRSADDIRDHGDSEDCVIVQALWRARQKGFETPGNVLHDKTIHKAQEDGYNELPPLKRYERKLGDLKSDQFSSLKDAVGGGCVRVSGLDFELPKFVTENTAKTVLVEVPNSDTPITLPLQAAATVGQVKKAVALHLAVEPDLVVLQAHQVATHTFKPGEMGITYDDKGFVEEVRPDSQARAKRIFTGYQIVKVGTEKYSSDAVIKAEKSGSDYEITFKARQDHGVLYDDKQDVGDMDLRRLSATLALPQHIAIASGDGTVRVVDAHTMVQVLRLEHMGYVNSVSWNCYGTKLATGSGDGAVRIFCANSGTEESQVDLVVPILCVSWHPAATKLAIAADDKTVRIMDVSTGNEEVRFKHALPVCSVQWHPSGTKIMSGCDDDYCRVIDLSTGREAQCFKHVCAVRAVASNPEGTKIATGSTDCIACVFDLASGASEVWFKHDDFVTSVAWNPDGTQLATGSRDGFARIFDVSTGSLQVKFMHPGLVTQIEWNWKGTKLLTGCADGIVRVFDVKSGGKETEIDHGRFIHDVSWRPLSTKAPAGSVMPAGAGIMPGIVLS